MATTGNPLKRCDGVTRRDVIRLGALTALGLTAANWTAQRAARGAAVSKARRCILIWLDGGPSHIETFDPKPEAPSEVRGPFASIATAVPGVRVAELLPEMARRLDKVTVLRAVTSPLGEHNLASHYLLTGYQPSPALTYPSFGSVVSHLGDGRDTLPPYVAIPDVNPMGGEGYLPVPCHPFAVGGDPARPNFSVRDLDRKSVV